MALDKYIYLFFEYQYLVFEIANKYNPNKYNIDNITDAGICGLLCAAENISDIKQSENIDFKSYAMFHIKSEIN
jgi:DNA-directed RNA polymerase specialized sigma subunit